MDCKKKNLWKQGSRINHVYEFALGLCLEGTMRSFFNQIRKAGYNRAIFLSMLHTVEALDGFHIVQSSASSPHCIPDAVCTHPVWSRFSPLFWSENELHFLQYTELLKASSWSFFFSFPYFHIYETSNTSCAWAEARRVSQPARLAAIIFIHHYVQPVSSPLWQGQTLLWWLESSKQCPKLGLSFGVGWHSPHATWEVISVEPQKGHQPKSGWYEMSVKLPSYLRGLSSKWAFPSGLADFENRFKPWQGSWVFFVFRMVTLKPSGQSMIALLKKDLRNQSITQYRGGLQAEPLCTLISLLRVTVNPRDWAVITLLVTYVANYSPC